MKGREEGKGRGEGRDRGRGRDEGEGKREGGRRGGQEGGGGERGEGGRDLQTVAASHSFSYQQRIKQVKRVPVTLLVLKSFV